MGYRDSILNSFYGKKGNLTAVWLQALSKPIALIAGYARRFCPKWVACVCYRTNWRRVRYQIISRICFYSWLISFLIVLRQKPFIYGPISLLNFRIFFLRPELLWKKSFTYRWYFEISFLKDQISDSRIIFFDENFPQYRRHFTC